MSVCFSDNCVVAFQVPRKFGNTAITALVLVLLCVAHSAVAQDLSEAQDHARLGLSLARESKLPEAESELRKAVQIAPGVPSHRAQLGSILGLQGKWQEALESFQKAIDLDPTDINFRRETAAVQWQLRQRPEAEKNLRYVLAKHPDDSGAILLLGLVSEANGDFANAARLLNSQFELVISQPDRTVALFESLFQSGQGSGTARIVDALKLRPNDSTWASAIGRCAQIAAIGGDLETSELLFSLLVPNDSSRSAAGFEVAKLRYRMGKVAEAQQLLTQLADTGPGGANIQSLLGHCYQSLHQPDLALHAYQRAVDLDPSQVARYEDLILLQLDLGQTDEALSLGKRVTSVAPSDAKSWVLEGNVELRTNAFQDAAKSFECAHSLDHSNADAVLGLATVHSVAGLTDTAISDYKVGIQEFPKDPRFYVAYAAALLASPEGPQAYPQAENLLQQAIKLDSGSPDAHYQLGQLDLRQGKLNEARNEFLTSLQGDPDRSNTHFALSLAYRRMGQSDEAAKHFAIYERLKQSEEHGMSSPNPVVAKP